MFRKQYGENYVCARDGTIVTSAKGKSLNLEEVLSILKSKDASKYDKNHYMWDGESRFLDRKPLPSKIAFPAFARHGSSMMRKMIEQATGIATSSTGSLSTGTYL
jgi:hypothetical protein